MSSLLPPNATPFETALADALAVATAIPAPLRELWNPATCPAALLPWLAWALSVDDWDAEWSDTVKRQTVAEALEIHRRKGTPWAVERALMLAGAPNATLEEWFEYDGDPYYFRVTVDIEGASVSGETQAKMLRSILVHKNVRSWLDGILYVFSVAGDTPVFGAALATAETITVYSPGVTETGGQGDERLLAVADGQGWRIMRTSDGHAIALSE